MPTETVKVEEKAALIRSERALESSSGNYLVRSRTLSSVFIFLVFFIVLASILPQRVRIDFLIRKLSADCWCPRFERFLCSSSEPDILILSSSVGFVPSMMADIKNSAVVVPTSVIELQKLSVNYACPAFFLTALSGHGIKNVSAAHMGIPTANITDDLLLLEKALAFGKRPEVVILAVNVRDFAVPSNWPAIDKLEEPIKTELGDIIPMPAMLSGSRILRELFAYARPGQLISCLENYRFYFAYETYSMTRSIPLFKGIFGQSDILRNRMVTEFESKNLYNSQDATGVNSTKLNPQTQNDILALTNISFEDSQFAALRQVVALTQSHGIKLIMAPVPVYPGIVAPSNLAKRYSGAIAGAAREKGVFVLRFKDGEYSYGHFSDLLHLNGVGGERFFWCLADYMATHKTELLSQ